MEELKKACEECSGTLEEVGGIGKSTQIVKGGEVVGIIEAVLYQCDTCKKVVIE